MKNVGFKVLAPVLLAFTLAGCGDGVVTKEKFDGTVLKIDVAQGIVLEYKAGNEDASRPDLLWNVGSLDGGMEVCVDYVVGEPDMKCRPIHYKLMTESEMRVARDRIAMYLDESIKELQTKVAPALS